MKRIFVYLIRALLAIIMLLGFMFGIFGGAVLSLIVAGAIAVYFAAVWRSRHREDDKIGETH